jgi:hypothetical protein
MRVQALIRGKAQRQRERLSRALEVREQRAEATLSRWARRRRIWLATRAAHEDLCSRGPGEASGDVVTANGEATDDGHVGAPSAVDVGGDEGAGDGAGEEGGGAGASKLASGARLRKFASKRRMVYGVQRTAPPPPTMARDYSAMRGRSVRVFLSSTFRDMNDERAIFLKRFAPSLRQQALERGVFLTFVDLRWGVTKDQATGGEVVNICLEQLSGSRYFVSFLGLRYGWRPGKEHLTDDTFGRFGHMLESYCPGRSVTEFEVIYGALGWSKDAACPCASAFFYMRDDAYAEGVSDEDKPAFIDDDRVAQSRLSDLKKRIRRRAEESSKHHGRAVNGAKLPFVECVREYARPEDFAGRLYRDLSSAINRDFPRTDKNRPLSPLDEAFLRHVSYAQQLTRVHVGHEAIAARIEAYVGGMAPTSDERRPLVLVGEPGVGKSAALATWLFSTAAEGFLLPHFCGSTSNSNMHLEVSRHTASRAATHRATLRPRNPRPLYALDTTDRPIGPTRSV